MPCSCWSKYCQVGCGSHLWLSLSHSWVDLLFYCLVFIRILEVETWSNYLIQFFFETRSYCVAQAGLEPAVLLLLPSQWWNHRCIPPCLTQPFYQSFNAHSWQQPPFPPSSSSSLLFFSGLGIKLRALCMLNVYPATELHHQTLHRLYWRFWK